MRVVWRSRASLLLALGLVACGPEKIATDAGDESADRGGEERGEEVGEADSRTDDGGLDEGGKDGGAAETKGEEDRECFGCIYEAAPALCPEAWEACKDSLACTQLLDCPFACGATEECLDECNEIIPSGVEDLTAVMACAVCAADAPCAESCLGSVIEGYCG